MEFKNVRISVILVCMVLGFMLALQFRSTQDIKDNSNTQRVEELAARLQQKESDNRALQSELDELKFSTGDEQQKKIYEDMKSAAGLTALEGQGVIVKIDDSKKTAKQRGDQNSYLVHDEDILKIINELRAAGAEAISVNGQRLVAASEVRCAGPTLSVNNVRTAPPFEIRAIGDIKSLVNALKMRGGVADSLKVWGIELQIEESSRVFVPAFEGTNKFKYARLSTRQEGEK